MDTSSPLFEFHPNTVKAVRKEINLDKPGRMEEAIKLLEEWIRKQNHFMKKDFPRAYLETTLITSKGLLERAKQKIDKLCTLRSLMSDYFLPTFSKETFAPLEPCIHQCYLPKLTKEQNRIYILKMVGNDFDASTINVFYRSAVVIGEYSKRYDYHTGYIIICDYRDVNLLHYISTLSPIILRNMHILMTAGYGLRVKSIEIISSSKMVDSLVLLMKQAFSAKIGGRINVHKDIDSLYKVIDKDILPADYGGKEKSVKELYDLLLDEVCSKDHVEFFKEMNKARTNETYRQTDVFNEQYAGMPGSFRVLNVD